MAVRSSYWVGAFAFGVAVATASAGPSAPPLRDVLQVSVGNLHSCVLQRNGTVSCWGSNEIAQLGLGDNLDATARPSAAAVQGLGSGIRAIAAGHAHTCAITAERGVKCWGLGLPSGTDRYATGVPRAVEGLEAAVESISSGGEHSCAVLQGGQLKCWGANDRGQLGDGSSGNRLAAVAVQGLTAPVRFVEAGERHTCAALQNGEVRCWGANTFGQLGDGSRDDRRTATAVLGLPSAVRSLAAGAGASCAVTDAGALYCWGAQYPLGAFPEDALRAQAYPGFASGYRAVDAGNHHFCALAEDASIKCLGENADGQLGTGPVDGSLGAETVVGLAAGVVELASGGGHNCARTSAGGLQCWGWNLRGQLGIDKIGTRLVPTAVVGMESAAAMAGGGRFSCGLTAAGGAKCWGYNLNGELGDGSHRTRLTAVEVVGVSSGALALASGDERSCVITAQRGVKCWGGGDLGNGQPTSERVAVDVIDLGADALALALGRKHVCVLLAGGAVKCWGSNEFGELGTGDGLDRITPTAVPGLASGVSAIAAGYYHTCATLSSGMKCWGHNQFGQLGDGSFVHRSTPVDVLGIGAAPRDIEAGIAHTCAILQNGVVHCWGAAVSGTLLGDGAVADRAVPGEVPGLRQGAVQLALGGSHSCARMADGALQCWGQAGSIGDNSEVHRPTPVAVAGLNRGVTQVSSGFGGQTCAVVAGVGKCWGANRDGQIGDGSTHGEPTAQTALSNELVRRVAPLAEAANAGSEGLQFDASGRYALFQSAADNLVDGDSNGAADLFLRDRESGQTLRISVDNAGVQLAGGSSAASMSADARRIVFVAADSAPASLLGESKAQQQARRKSILQAVFLRNLLTGTTQRVAGLPAGSLGKPQIAPGGTAVAYTAAADGTQGSAGQNNVFVVPLVALGDSLSVGTPLCASCKSVAADGSATAANSDGASSAGVFSADGQWLAYQSQAGNALAASALPCPGGSQVLLRNLNTGVLQRISPPDGLDAAQCGSAGSQQPSIDYAGATVAFQSDQGLLGEDRNALDDAYVWQAGRSELLRVSGSTVGDAAAAAQAPQISGDGQHVAFISAATDIDLGFADNNDRADVHAVALADPGSVLRLSRTPTGAETDAASAAPALNYDGSQLGFVSAAANLLTGVNSASVDRVFARSNPLAPAKQSATWWIPGESGWGLTVFDQGNLLAPTWFTYDNDGEPTWFIVAGAFPQPDGSFRGDLLRLTGTPLAQIDGPATRSVAAVGDVALRYFGDSALQFDYQLEGIRQGKTLQRFGFGSRGFACSASAQSSRARSSNYTDLWSGAGADAGWGLTLFHIDDAVVAIWYTYDDDGEAVFFVITTAKQTDGSFAGEVFRQRNGTPFSQIDGHPPSAAADRVGSASFRFSDGENASFSYVLNGVNQSKPIRRLLVGNQASECRAENQP